MRLSSWLLLVFLISSCSSPSTPIPLQPTATASQNPPTSTPTIAIISARLTERVGTVIALQTASTTPLATHTPTSTPTSSPVDVSNPTAIVHATQETLFLRYCHMGWSYYFFNDRWAVCDMDDKTFAIFSKEGQIWNFSYVDLGMSAGGEGYEFQTQVIYWGRDGRYIYVTPDLMQYDPLIPFYGDGLALMRIDLTNGQIQFVIEPTGDFYSMTFSPSGRQMSYAVFSKPLDLVIQDMQSGEQRHIEIDPKYTQAGEFTWSDDEKKLAYKLVIDNDECSRKFTIVLLDINTMKTTTVINDTAVYTCQPFDPTYYIKDISDDSIILEQNGDIWNYDLSTQQLMLKATATPKP